MTKLFLAAGVAALAIAVPVSAERGGQGGQKGQGAAKAERGGGKAAKVERGGQRLVSAERGKGREARVDRGLSRIAVRGNDRRSARVDRKDRDFRIAGRNDRRDDVRLGLWDEDRFVPGRGHPLGGIGCPPGLAKQNELCMPPGQYKKLGSALPAAYRNSLLPAGLRDLYRDDDDYFYRLGDGGYLYRVDRRTSLIESLLPLLGGGLMTGQRFPSAYGSYGVPSPYRAFYPDTNDDYYRFANGYVYEIDRDTGMIESMVPLMANGYGMGQMMPMSYSAYNVPYQYRGLYPDGGDSMYRYAPGAIYQVDPTTRLVTAVASLLSGNGLSVGQPLPTGYGAYNVPLAYRDQYYDTPDSWYRYNNGNIYQVDPTTQLVTALIRSII